MGRQHPSKIVSENSEQEPDLTGSETGSKQVESWFKPGVSGNKNGRPRGSRSRINEKFLGALERIWDEHGEDAMAKAALGEPMQFVKMVAGLLPSKVESSLQITNVFAQYNLADPREFGQAWEIARKVVYGQAPLEIEADPVGELEAVDDE
jgi:hypothetical protein